MWKTEMSKDSHKIECSACNGTGLEEGTHDDYPCAFCDGTGLDRKATMIKMYELFVKSTENTPIPYDIHNKFRLSLHNLKSCMEEIKTAD